MKPESYREIIDGALDSGMPPRVDLLPQIATRFTKGQSALKTQKKIALGLALALIVFAIAFFALPGAVTALQRLLGYVPNVGVVDQSVVPVRKLAAPVSQTRDGVTVDVTHVTLTSVSTLVHIRISGIPFLAYPSPPPEGVPFTGFDVPTCDGFPHLRQPDGTLNEIGGGMPGFGIGDTLLEGDWTLTPVPAGVDSAILIIPCIPMTVTGRVPENWELPLRFIPADPSDVLPVIEPAPATGAGPDPAQPPATLDGVLTLDSVVHLPDGEAFYGTLRWPNSSEFFSADVSAFHLADADGNPILADVIFDMGALPKNRPFVPVGIKTRAPLSSQGPVTLSVDEVQVIPYGVQEFIVDTGPDPQPGQQWSLDQESGAPEYHVRLLSVTRLADGYRLTFQAGSMGGLSMQAYAYTADDNSFPIGDCLPQGENLDCAVKYTSAPPAGRLQIGYLLTITLTGPWQVTWQP